MDDIRRMEEETKRQLDEVSRMPGDSVCGCQGDWDLDTSKGTISSCSKNRPGSVVDKVTARQYGDYKENSLCSGVRCG